MNIAAFNGNNPFVFYSFVICSQPSAHLIFPDSDVCRNSGKLRKHEVKGFVRYLYTGINTRFIHHLRNLPLIWNFPPHPCAVTCFSPWTAGCWSRFTFYGLLIAPLWVKWVSPKELACLVPKLDVDSAAGAEVLSHYSDFRAPRLWTSARGQTCDCGGLKNKQKEKQRRRN